MKNTLIIVAIALIFMCLYGEYGCTTNYPPDADTTETDTLSISSTGISLYPYYEYCYFDTISVNYGNRKFTFAINDTLLGLNDYYLIYFLLERYQNKIYELQNEIEKLKDEHIFHAPTDENYPDCYDREESEK